MDEEDVIHVYSGLLAIKKNENNTICSKMDTKWIQHGYNILNEVSQMKKDKCHMIPLLCGL